MKSRSKVVLFLAVGLGVATAIVNQWSARSSSYQGSVNYKDGEFVNSSAMQGTDYWAVLKKYWQVEAVENYPNSAIPVNELSTQAILSLPDDKLTVIRFGHSSSLLKIANQFWLLDPVFSERASPVSFIGPKRFHQPPISIAELPQIDGVIISHNHYDHLDKQAIQDLRDKVNHFVVPLGLSKVLQGWGVDGTKVQELDWWESLNFSELEIIATPAQHFSGRGVFDHNRTLWASWALRSETQSLFYSGDSGYFSGFKKIGNVLGPFDLALLEVGAYDPLWPGVHMMPAQAVQASQDLVSRHMMPIHNSTFDLAFHPWYEPLELVTKIALEEQVSVITPVVGQPISLNEGNMVGDNLQWWLDVK